MAEYKVLKEIRHQNNAGEIIVFSVGGKVTEKDFTFKKYINGKYEDILNKKMLNGFVKDGFLEDDKKAKKAEVKDEKVKS